MSAAFLSVTNCPFKTTGYPVSGILPARKRSIFRMVVFPNVPSRPALSSRDRSRPLLTTGSPHA
jgi:hypothetical protein